MIEKATHRPTWPLFKITNDSLHNHGCKGLTFISAYSGTSLAAFWSYSEEEYGDTVHGSANKVVESYFTPFGWGGVHLEVDPFMCAHHS